MGEELVPITPIEYQGKRNRIVRYFGYKLTDFDAETLISVMKKIDTKLAPKIWQESGMTFYEYPDKPLIIIKERDFYPMKEVLNTFDKKQVRQQASILLRILKDNNLAGYKKRTAIQRWKFVPGKYREESKEKT